MRAIFVELAPFRKYRSDYLTDDEYRLLQEEMLAKPDAGDLIQGTGGLRKLRFADKRRNKGKRGGLQFWMFTLYDKDEMSDLTSDERKILARMLDAEIAQRSAR
jgi:hypothetical protein